MPSARTTEPNWTKIWTKPLATLAMSAMAVATLVANVRKRPLLP